APLIAVGVGFHPELTGRENVFVNGMILGLSRRQVEERLEAIVDFADIPGFLDTPVKFYSSGMFVRLGFSVAVHSDPDVLLVDEVLAVGDLGFQVKCFDRMTEIRERGATIVVVSHNLNAVRHLCSRTAVLHRGSVRFCGTTPDAISVFHDLMAGEGDVPAQDGELPRRAGVAEVSGVDLVGPDGRSTRHLAANSTATFRLGVRLHAPLERAFFGMGVTNEAGANVYSEASWSLDTGPLVAGSDVVCEVPVQLPLATGTYTAHLSVYDSDMAQVAVAPTLAFYVSNRETVDGVADLAAGFRLCPTD
ncbi:MAG TPA: Wzt carbohydrate-binding domain-containing protein, partial [Acidimicrobiales bacterium]|nr:Wzt carbohydrate-binding domain-containing protein [Acidimicrobiales bacterium]